MFLNPLGGKYCNSPTKINISSGAESSFVELGPKYLILSDMINMWVYGLFGKKPR